MSSLVRANGGVLWRHATEGTEILIAHRPRYDDWSLPKGKLEDAETDEECALREVEEETGLRCSLGRELDAVDYVDARGRPKTVRYWAMQVEGGEFAPNEEVDEVRWLAPAEALRFLSYAGDRSVVSSFLNALGTDFEP